MFPTGMTDWCNSALLHMPYLPKSTFFFMGMEDRNSDQVHSKGSVCFVFANIHWPSRVAVFTITVEKLSTVSWQKIELQERMKNWGHLSAHKIRLPRISVLLNDNRLYIKIFVFTLENSMIK